MKGLLSISLVFLFILLFQGSASDPYYLKKFFEKLNISGENITLVKEFLLDPRQVEDFYGQKTILYNKSATGYLYDTSEPEGSRQKKKVPLSILIYKETKSGHLIQHPALKQKYMGLEDYAEFLAFFLHTGYKKVSAKVNKAEKPQLSSLYQKFGFVQTDPNNPMSGLQLVSRTFNAKKVNEENTAEINTKIKKMREDYNSKVKNELNKITDAPINYYEKDGCVCTDFELFGSTGWVYIQSIIGYLTYHEQEDEFKTEAEKGQMVFVVDYVGAAVGREKEPIILQLLQRFLYELDEKRKEKGLVIKMSAKEKDPDVMHVFEKCGFSEHTFFDLVKEREIAEKPKKRGIANRSKEGEAPETSKKREVAEAPKKRMRIDGADVKDKHTSYTRVFRAKYPPIFGNYCDY